MRFSFTFFFSLQISFNQCLNNQSFLLINLLSISLLIAFFSGLIFNKLWRLTKRKHSDFQGEKIEENFIKIFNHTFQFIGLLDLEGNLLAANATALNCVGVKEEQVIGQPFWETPWWSHSSQYQTQLKESIQAAATGKIIRFQATHFDKNNQKIYVDFSLKPVKNERGEIIFLIPEGRDITEIKETEKKLQKSQAELQAILNIIPDLFFRMDAEAIILEYRGSSRSEIYVSPEIFLGKSMLQMLPHPVAKQWEKAINKVLKSKTLISLEYSLTMATGEEYYEGRLVPFSKNQIIAIVRNITEARQAEIELKKSQTFLQTIIDYLPVALFVKDGKAKKFGQLLLVNKACEDIFGLVSSKVIAKTAHDLFPPEQANFYEQKDREAFKQGELIDIPEEPIDSYNKGSRIIHTIKVPVYDEHQQPDYLVCITEDITQQKQAEKQQEASENKLQALLKYSADIVSIFDREGQLIYNSPAGEKIYGFSLEEMQQQRTFYFIHPEDRTRVGKTFSKLLQEPEKTITVEYRYQTKQGNYIWMETVASNQLDNPNIKGIVANSREITQRKQVETALRESEEKFRQLAENIREVFWIIDISKTDPTYHKSIYVSPTYQKVWGHNPEELYEHPMQWLEVIHPEDRERIEKNLSQKLFQGAFDHEYRIIRPDGTLRWIRDRGFPIQNQLGELVRITGLAEDITEQRVTQEEIKRLNKTLTQQNRDLEEIVSQRTEELEMLLNTLPDFVFVVERHTMKLLFCNQVFAEGIGLKEQKEVEGQTIFDCFPAEMADYFAQQNEQVFNSGKTLHIEQTITLPDGDRYFDTYKVPLRNPQGEIYALLATARDLTELVKTKKILMERSTQLEATNQELDAFCYSVSHDLRAPLRHIHGFVNALKQRLTESEVLEDAKVVHYLDVIQKSSEKMGYLIDGLLTLSRVGRRELLFNTVNLNGVVKAAINLVTFEDNQIEFVIGTLPIIQGDMALLQQVFVNLLENSIKFSRGRNPILIKIDVLENGTIFVSDNGVGFDMDYADKLFGAFQRLHSQKEFPGTGIGLSIVQRIIHRHGGNIWAESPPGNGATFYISFPN
ncbi:MAG: PAS domain S-box protein [Crocosphaera sp.]